MGSIHTVGNFYLGSSLLNCWKLRVGKKMRRKIPPTASSTNVDESCHLYCCSISCRVLINAELSPMLLRIPIQSRAASVGSGVEEASTAVDVSVVKAQQPIHHPLHQHHTIFSEPKW